MSDWLLQKKWRVITAGLLLVAAPLIGLAIYVYLIFTAALEERLLKETTWFSTTAANSIERQLEDYITLGDIFVSRPSLLDATGRSDLDEISRHLRDLVETSPDLDRAFIASEKGVLLADYPVVPKVHGVDFSYRDWYKGVSNGWQPYISEFYMREAEPKRYLFAIAIPVMAGARVAGILVMQPNPDFLTRAMSAVAIGRGHYHVVDKKGILIYEAEVAERNGKLAYEPAVIDTVIESEEYSELRQFIKGEGGSEWLTHGNSGQPYAVAYHDVRGRGLWTIVCKPYSVVSESVRKLSYSLFMVTSIMLIIGGLLSYLLSNALISKKMISMERDRLFNNSIDMLCIAGFDGHFRQVNPAFEKTLGWPKDVIEAKPLNDLVHPDDRRATVDAMNELNKGISLNGLENRYLCRDGSYKWISWNAAPTTDVGAIFMIGRDITERRAMMDELHKAHSVLENKVEERTSELRRSNEELQQFAYMVSHDLQEPLRMISSYLQLLSRRYKDSLDKDAGEFIHYAVDGAQRLQGMINDLLAYSRVHTDARQPVPVDSEEILERALKNLEVAISESGARVIHDPLPQVMADPTQLGQVFQNLISNAIKFRRPDVPHEIRISATKDGRMWVFTVRDNGIGIDQKDHGRVFKLFQRLNSRSEYPGTGIGLSICQRIVKRLGGDIWLESAPGEGSSFSFTLYGAPEVERA